MKRSAIPLALLVLLLASCGHRTGPAPLLPPEPADRNERCRAPFPTGAWRAVHVIEGDLPLGRRIAIIGVIAGDADSRSLRVVGMLAEGLVLFDVASRAGTLEIRRAQEPLDDPAFLQRLVDDVHFLFLEPRGDPIETGRTPDGGRSCRWRGADGRVNEVLLPGEGGWVLREFGPEGDLIRQARAREPITDGFAREMELVVYGRPGYSLRLRLVEAEVLDSAAGLMEP